MVIRRLDDTMPLPVGSTPWSRAPTQRDTTNLTERVFTAGTLLSARYELVDPIGQGGFGSVWRARDRVTEGFVAVKLLRSHSADQSTRMRREIAALRLLQLPGVVRLLDEGLDDGSPFIVMELVDGAHFPGRPLPVPWSELEATVLSLVETLARVHAAGIVHRDIKPLNVLVDATGHPVLLDFGLVVGDPVGRRETLDGAFVGTPDYLAPEQVTGGRVDGRTDLYSLGVVLYEALCGSLPHEGADPVSRIQGRLHRRPVPSRERNPLLPPHVASLIDALLSIRLEERPGSAWEVRERLGGDVVPSGILDLPWVGGTALVDVVVEAARAGRPVRVGGGPGTGRSRLVEEAVSRLVAEGRIVHHGRAADRPLRSLAHLIPGFEEFGDTTLDDATRRVREGLRDRLLAGEVLVLDGSDRFDPWSSRVSAALEGPGAVIRVVDEREEADVVPQPLQPDDLRVLFAGPDRLLHLGEDAAVELGRRTGGIAGEVHGELAAWVRGGLARVEGRQVEVARAALDRLEAGLTVLRPLATRCPPLPGSSQLRDLLAWLDLAAGSATLRLAASALAQPAWEVEAAIGELCRLGLVRRHGDRLESRWPGLAAMDWGEERRIEAHRRIATELPVGSRERLYQWVASGASAEVAREATASARRLADEGRIGPAWAVLTEGLLAVRGANAEEQTPVLVLAMCLAVQRADGVAFDEMGYELMRMSPAPVVGWLRSLARAGADAMRGRAAEARELLDALESAPDPELAYCWHAIAVVASKRGTVGEQEVVLAEAERWAETGTVEDALDVVRGWRGNALYRMGRYREAGDLQDRVAERLRRPVQRLSALTNAGLAWLEAGDGERCRSAAGKAKELAARCRHAGLEARAEYLLRACDRRFGGGGAPDWELVRAASILGLHEPIGLIALNEAAIAWSLGDRQAAMHLARISREAWSAIRSRPAELLAWSLDLASGAEDPTELEDALTTVASDLPPEIAVQCWGLLATAPGPAGERARIEARRFLQRIPEGDRDKVGEILSPRVAASGPSLEVGRP